MPLFTYSLADFLPFTKIVSADMNTKLNDIKTFLNTTKLDSTNIQDGGVTRGTKLSAGTANAVVINNGSGAMTDETTLARSRGGLQFAPTLTGNAGNAVVVNDAETAFQLGSPSQGSLTENLSSDVASLTAGETIAINDAVCLDITKDASNNNIYRLFKCDSDLGNRRTNFIGIATTIGTVVAGNYTWTDSAALVTSNSVAFTVNGRSYTQAFTTDNDTTLAAIAVKLATDPDIQSASVVDAGSNDRIINIVGRGGLFLNIAGTVTGGASQATITITIPQAPSGTSVRIRTFGTVTTFSGLVTGSIYYLSGTTGAITALPSDTLPVQVGQALSSTVLFVASNLRIFQFGTPTVFVRIKGAASALGAGATSDAEHFNLVSWTAGTSDSTSKMTIQAGNSALNGKLYSIDGLDPAGTLPLSARSYNKVSYIAETNRNTARCDGAVTNLANLLYVTRGTTDTNGDFNTAASLADTYNGTAWSAGVFSTNQPVIGGGAFLNAGLIHLVGGKNSAGTNQALHETYNGSSLATSTVIPTSGLSGSSGESSINGISSSIAATTAGFFWNGSWSSSIAQPYISRSTVREMSASAFVSSGNKFYINGGANAGTATNNSASFNGASWSSETSSTNSRNAGQGGGL